MEHPVRRIKRGISLERQLGLFSATMCGVGIILGAGIYVLIGVAAGGAGNAVWLSFVLASLVAVFTGLSYAELSSMYPSDAAEYTYAAHAFGKATGFFVGYIAFLMLIIANVAVALGFAGYFTGLFGIDHTRLIAFVVVALFSIINFRGIKESSTLNILFTFLETAGLIAIILFAIPYLGTVSYLEMPHGFTGVAKTASLVFFAYIGFESVVKLSEETRDPTKTIPRALLLSLAISTVLYVLVALSAVSVIPWDQLSSSASPLADVAAAIVGSKAFIAISIVALFSTANTVLVCLVASSRVLYGMSEQFPRFALFRRIHPTTRTPHFAVLASFIVSIPFLFLKDISLVAEYTNFAIFVSFIIVNASLIALRYKNPGQKRGFRVPVAIGTLPLLPIAGIVMSILFIHQLSVGVILGGAGYSLVGLLLYMVIRERKKV